MLDHFDFARVFNEHLKVDSDGWICECDFDSHRGTRENVRRRIDEFTSEFSTNVSLLLKACHITQVDTIAVWARISVRPNLADRE